MASSIVVIMAVDMAVGMAIGMAIGMTIAVTVDNAIAITICGNVVSVGQLPVTLP